MEQVRKCPTCAKDIVRRAGEDRTNFTKRTFCSRECRYIPQKLEKPCLHCGEVFPALEGTGAARFKKQKYCSKSCASLASARSKTPEEKAARNATIRARKNENRKALHIATKNTPPKKMNEQGRISYPCVETYWTNALAGRTFG